MINIIDINIKNAGEDYHKALEQYLAEKPQEDFFFVIQPQEDSYSQGRIGHGKKDSFNLDLPVYECNHMGCTIFTGTGTFLAALYARNWSNAVHTIFKNGFLFFSSFFKDTFNIVLDKPKLWMPLCVKGRGLIYQAKSEVSHPKQTLFEFMIPMTKDAKEKNTVLKHHVLPPTCLEDEGIHLTHHEFSEIFQNYVKNYFSKEG